jgi:hypothetical protein
MIQNGTHAQGHPEAPAVRKPWLAPRVDDLPRLTELTLQTGGGIPGDCDIGGGGSTCF